MTLAARIGDITIGTDCIPPGTCTGVIVSGASRTIIEGSPAARIGDIVVSTCGGIGIIDSGASHTIIEGSPAARIFDHFSGCYTGIIIGSASKTHIE